MLPAETANGSTTFPWFCLPAGSGKELLKLFIEECLGITVISGRLPAGNLLILH